MKSFQFTFAVLFICLTAAGIQAGPPWKYHPKPIPIPWSAELNISSYGQYKHKQIVGKVISLLRDIGLEDAGAKFKLPKMPLPINNTEFGVSPVMYYQEGHLCNGVHFSPWVIMTTASCVEGRDLKRLYVQVHHKTVDRFTYTVPVRVHSYSIHPKYAPDKPEFNFAMMSIYSKYDWDVDQFYLPRHDYTLQEIQQKGIVPKVDELNMVNYLKNSFFQDYKVVSYPTKFNKDFEICGELGPSKNWYCTEKGAGRGTYKKTDVGTPVYYISPYGMKRLLGLYTGRISEKQMRGHTFEKIISAIPFIERFIVRHPLPPFW